MRRREIEAIKKNARRVSRSASLKIADGPLATGPTYETFQAGRHQIINGDSTDMMFVSDIIEENGVNLIIYDPPYQIKNAYDHIPEMCGNLVQLLAFWDCKRAGIAHVSANKKKWPFFSEVIWDNGQVNFRRDHEIDWAHKTCGIFGNVKWSSSCATQFMPLKEKRGFFTQNRKFSSMYKEKKTSVDRHQHAKPDHWIQSIISGAGGFANKRVALDMFGGGGSTLFAMEAIGGTAVVIEKDVSIFEMMKSSWFDHNTKRLQELLCK
jgi:hypothetical protein